jgi:Uma2 family endonuclease
MAVDTTRRYTVADLEHFPDDGRRYELIDGVLYVTPLARRRHQWVVGRITHRLTVWTERHGGTVYPGVNVTVAADTHLEPDVAYDRSEDTSGAGFDAAPDLVVEVSSPSTQHIDLGVKRERYAAEGAAEFWFVDLDLDEIHQFTGDEGGGFGPPAVHRRGAQFSSPLFAGLLFDVDDLLGGPEDTRAPD